ncbi:very short patch repair endonuclease [Pseudomonadota bacterium]
MVDNVDKKNRSRMMSNIRSSNTKPEVLTRKALHRLGYRFRLDSKVGKIKPDIVLRSLKVAIFVHGCYWHQHKDCKLAYSDREYSDKWKKKFDDNQKRDQRVLDKLTEEGWRVAIIWECATRDTEAFNDVINQLNTWIQSHQSQYFESQYKKS